MIKSIYGIVQVEYCWFKEYIKEMTLKEGFKSFKTDTYLLYRENELGTAIAIVCVDGTLVIGDKPSLVDTIECINK